jgi:Tfp pilus assembly protein PilO
MIKNVLFMLIILLFSACSKNQTILEQKENKELELKKELESKNELIAVIKEISMLIANDNTDLLNSR